MASSEGWISAYRIVAPEWAHVAFTGEGAAKYGGRWNPPGVRVVYLAGHRSLAALETLVHLTTPSSRAKRYYLIEAQFPAEKIWRAPVVTNSAGLGADWIAARKSLVMQVPSVVIPEEPNYLLNPRHPLMREVRIGEAIDFTFDSRL